MSSLKDLTVAQLSQRMLDLQEELLTRAHSFSPAAQEAQYWAEDIPHTCPDDGRQCTKLKV